MRKNSHTVYGMVIFCVKYWNKISNGSIAERCIEVVREICSANCVDTISGNVSPDHVHILISTPPHLSISKIMQSIKEESIRKLQFECQKLKKKYCGQHLCRRGYFVASFGQISITEVQKYIAEQEEHHKNDTFKISEL